MDFASEFRSDEMQSDGRGRQRRDSEQQFQFHDCSVVTRA